MRSRSEIPEFKCLWCGSDDYNIEESYLECNVCGYFSGLSDTQMEELRRYAQKKVCFCEDN